ELCGLLDRKIGGGGAMQGLLYMARRPPIEGAGTRPLGHETASLYPFPQSRNERQLMAERELRNLDPMRGKLGVICHHQRARSLHRDEYPVEIARGALVFDLQVNTKTARRSLGLEHILSRSWTGRAHQNRDSGELGEQLSHHLQSLGDDIAADAGRSSDAAAVPGESCEQPPCDPVD